MARPRQGNPTSSTPLIVTPSQRSVPRRPRPAPTGDRRRWRRPGVTGLLLGRSGAATAMRRSLAGAEAVELGRVMQHPDFARAVFLAWADRHDESVATFTSLADRASDIGDEVSRPRLLFGLSYAAWQQGRWAEASRAGRRGRPGSEARRPATSVRAPALLRSRRRRASWSPGPPRDRSGRARHDDRPRRRRRRGRTRPQRARDRRSRARTPLSRSSRGRGSWSRAPSGRRPTRSKRSSGSTGSTPPRSSSTVMSTEHEPAGALSRSPTASQPGAARGAGRPRRSPEGRRRFACGLVDATTALRAWTRAAGRRDRRRQGAAKRLARERLEEAQQIFAGLGATSGSSTPATIWPASAGAPDLVV